VRAPQGAANNGSVAADVREACDYVEDLIKLQRVAEAAISPDGKWVAYTVVVPDMEANRNASTTMACGDERGRSDSVDAEREGFFAVWSPDGKAIAFISSRSGDGQVYLLSMEGGEPHR